MRERRGPRGQRLFNYGELRLLLLVMMETQPRHGYELIKEIEDRFEGNYSPSPGVIYPTLSWLDDMGYAKIELSEGSKKQYSITNEGLAFLTANRAAADELLTRSIKERRHGERRGEHRGEYRERGEDAAFDNVRALFGALRHTIHEKLFKHDVQAETREKIIAILRKADEEIKNIS